MGVRQLIIHLHGITGEQVEVVQALLNITDPIMHTYNPCYNGSVEKISRNDGFLWGEQRERFKTGFLCVALAVL